MGQEESRLVDDNEPTETLEERSLSAVASYIKSGKAKNVVVLTGAGISTSAGIPDFRSPKTGLYANLARLNIPEPEAVFDISFFRRNPNPFYVLAHELYPGKYKPTISHAFIALLAQKGLLGMLLTQNIDCLERAAGVPDASIIEAHGSFATQRCIECKRVFPDEEMKEHVEAGKVPRCQDEECAGLVKPDIVFFGESLPQAFGQSPVVMARADLVLVIGTSLSVYPFAGLPENTRPKVPRVLFNMERVGSMGSRADDVLVLGQCDEGVRKLARELGWDEELDQYWRGVVGEKEAQRQMSRSSGEDAEDEVQRLADNVEAKLNFEEHAEKESRTSEATEEKATPESPKEDQDSNLATKPLWKPEVAISNRVKKGMADLEGQAGVPGQRATDPPVEEEKNEKNEVDEKVTNRPTDEKEDKEKSVL